MADGGAGYSTSESISATWASSSRWDPTQIPPRPWIAPGYFLRGAVTVVVGAGGVSKSTLMVAHAVALALGKDFHGMHPVEPSRVMMFNVEDDAHEQQRRLTAVLTSMGRLPAAIEDKVMRVGPTRVGTLLVRDDDQVLVRTDAMMELVATINAFKPDVLILDPLAELHTEDENANVALREVVAEFRALATENKMAVVLVHHTRKGVVIAGDMDAGRGASSIVSAARIALTVVNMTAEEEQALGLPVDTRKHYFRVDGGKSNYAALTDCEWFERQAYDLGQGDFVAVPKPWNPPDEAVTPEIQVKVEAAIRRGSPQGPWSPQLGNTPRSVKNAMVEAGITTKPGQQAMLQALYRDGFNQVQFRDSFRKWANGIRSPDGQPSSVEWKNDQPEQQ